MEGKIAFSYPTGYKIQIMLLTKTRYENMVFSFPIQHVMSNVNREVKCILEKDGFISPYELEHSYVVSSEEIVVKTFKKLKKSLKKKEKLFESLSDYESFGM